MRLPLGIVAIATVPAWMCLHAGPAAAQTLMSDGPSFRMHTQSQLPKHLTQSQLPQRLKKKSRHCKRDLRPEESLHMVRRIAQPLDHSTEFFPEKPHTIRIRQERQRAVHRSIGICQLQRTAACRSAREFALLILQPIDQ